MTLRRAAPRRCRPAATLAALLALAPLAACGDATAPRPPLEGQWVAPGSPDLGATGTTIELALEQAGSDVRGEGSLVLPGQFVATLTVDGLVSGDVVQLVMTGPALAAPLVYNALLSSNRASMVGTLAQGTETAPTRTFTKTR